MSYFMGNSNVDLWLQSVTRMTGSLGISWEWIGQVKEMF